VKITFVAHASILIETRGLRILSDPWWKGPCFGTQWWVYPGAYLEPVEGRKIDYIYVSHGHHDHFHPGTLRTLPRSARVLVAKGFDIAPSIRELGFEVIEVEVDKELDLGSNVRIRIEPTYHDDSLFAITDQEQTCLNLNDALHSAPVPVQDRFIARLRAFYPKGIDYVFCGYGIASHFPNCYVIPEKDNAASAGARQKHFNASWARLMNGLRPRFAFPFAADVVFLEQDLFWANEPTHNTERPTDALRRQYPGAQIEAIDIAPGFIIENHTVVQQRLRVPISEQKLRQELPAAMEKANRFAPVSNAQIEELAELVRQNARVAEPYLSTYPGDYRCLIQIRNSQLGIEVSKTGRKINVLATPELRHDLYDVIYTTRFPYLKSSLVTQYGSEVLFVGSGGIFEYTSRDAVQRDIHRELMQVLKKQISCPAPRYGGSSHFVHQAKQAVKQMLSMTTPDLYDLERWTVYRNRNEGELAKTERPE
jgi:Beta-lactamase superfamily domain